MGEIDPLGTRKDGLDAFLEQKVEEGYTIETRTDTHAIIARRPEGLKRFTSGVDPGRYVVEVDEHGIAKMRPAEPRRAWSLREPPERRNIVRHSLEETWYVLEVRLAEDAFTAAARRERE
jgi:hypothetical protein